MTHHFHLLQNPGSEMQMDTPQEGTFAGNSGSILVNPGRSALIQTEADHQNISVFEEKEAR